MKVIRYESCLPYKKIKISQLSSASDCDTQNIMSLDDIITVQEIEETQEYLRQHVAKMPLLPLNVSYPDKKVTEVYLKLENLSPIGSFKLRGAINCLRHLSKDDLANGVVTASTGNFAQGLLWACRARGVACKIIVPDATPHTKLAAIERLGGTIIKMADQDWSNVIETHEYPGSLEEKFIHPVCNRHIVLGNTTIAKEIYDDLPDVDTVLVSYGGGALAAGIGSMFKAFKPSVKVIVCETDAASPLTAAFQAGKPVVVDIKLNFIDTLGCRTVLPQFYNIVRKVVDNTAVVSVDSVASTIKLLAECNRVIAEGAGAVTVAAAMQSLAGTGNIACVVSGGNIDTAELMTILNGGIPMK